MKTKIENNFKEILDKKNENNFKESLKEIFKKISKNFPKFSKKNENKKNSVEMDKNHIPSDLPPIGEFSGQKSADLRLKFGRKKSNLSVQLEKCL